jgi:uncharacterized membrane protein YqjE
MLIESVKGLGKTFVQILCTRLETLSLDIKEDRIRFVSLLVLGASTVALLTLGVVTGALWIVLAFGEANRVLVVGLLTGIFLTAGLIAMAFMIRRLTTLPGAFEGTIAELDKDREALGGLGKKGDS